MRRNKALMVAAFSKGLPPSDWEYEGKRSFCRHITPKAYNIFKLVRLMERKRKHGGTVNGI
jgi:hypothetical protein